MKIISTLGGSGSTFINTSLEQYNYAALSFFGRSMNGWKLKHLMERLCPTFTKSYLRLLSACRLYKPVYIVLKKPDSFRTDWKRRRKKNYFGHFPDIPYPYPAEHMGTCLRDERDYLIYERDYRSGRLPIRKENISTESSKKLVETYFQEIRRLEREINATVVLMSNHWGEFGILKELAEDAIYLIRDPFNSLISHAKAQRHKADYRIRGLTDINSKEWIDSFLSGPRHYWIRHAENALTHPGSRIVRYCSFKDDWKKITDLPDITDRFSYRKNDVRATLTKESIDYINSKTRPLSERIGIPVY